MRPHKICSAERWTALCDGLNILPDLSTFDALIASHAEPHRCYHTLDHIAACLQHLDSVAELSDAPLEIEMAFWFHDAIYEPFSSKNEEDSAAWAANWLHDQGLEETSVARIADHILDTKTHQRPTTLDGQLMLDIDLSILGASANIFDAYELNIRREYKRVPSFIFRKKRKLILQNYLAREQIYFTNHFCNTLKQQARINLQRAISNL